MGGGYGFFLEGGENGDGMAESSTEERGERARENGRIEKRKEKKGKREKEIGQMKEKEKNNFI